MKYVGVPGAQKKTKHPTMDNEKEDSIKVCVSLTFKNCYFIKSVKNQERFILRK